MMAYTLQQNGATILSVLRMDVDNYKNDKSFWAKAIKIVYSVINCSPSTAIDLKMLMEMWIGKQVHYSCLLTFESFV